MRRTSLGTSTNVFYLSHFCLDSWNIDFFIIAKCIFDVYKTLSNGGKRVKALFGIHLRFPTTIYDNTITFMFLSFSRRKICPAILNV